jgi:2-methylisocitrate lyase-like PEP mutase family enzyme
MSDSADTFRKLHHGSTPLRLPNAWDAASARLFEAQGAAAIATTSAGVAWALGYRDGRIVPIDEMIAAAARMVRVLTVPLSVDIENGYSDSPQAVSETVERLMDLGVAGINIEDGADKPEVLAAKLESIGNAIAKAGGDLFVNARSDVFLASLVEKSKLVEESIVRGKRYEDAGADGLFLPGIVDANHIKAVVEAVSLPLNVMAWPGLANAAALGKLGVHRLSAGSGISQVIWQKAATLAKDFLQSGSSDPLSQASMTYLELQALFPE